MKRRLVRQKPRTEVSVVRVFGDGPTSRPPISMIGLLALAADRLLHELADRAVLERNEPRRWRTS
jgi:hypothetical protein